MDGGIQEASSSAPAAASSTNYMDSLGGGNTLGKGPPFMPTKYRDTAGTGMPSYFDTMGASSTSAQSEGSPPSTGAGAGLPSYADALSGGSGTTKPASYMPKKYKDTSGSGMPSYFNSMGSAPAPVDYNTPTVVSPVVPTPAAAAAPSGAGLPSYTNALSGGNTGKMKESSFMPKSYKESSGSGMPSYFDSMGSASNSNYSSPPAPVSTNSPASGTGMPSYTNALSGGSSDKMKQSSFMPKSYKQSSGSGMPSYFDSMGTAPTSYSSPPAPATTETSYASPAVSTNPTSDAGVSSYTSALSGGGPGKMKESSYMPKSFKQSPGSGMPSYFDSLGGGGNVANSPSSGTGSYLDSMNVASTPSGAGLPSYTDGLSGSGGAATAKQSSYMPKSYKQPTGAGMPSYLDNMGSAWSSPKVETKAPPPNIRPNIAPQTQAPPVNIRPNIAPQTQAPPANIRPNIAPLPGMKADQAAQLARIASPARGPSFNHPLANPITKSSTLPCDQTIIMREGESFLPHAQDPVIKRGTLEPDQSSAMRYFFTGRLCATEPFRAIPMKTRFPSDQERAENQTRQSLMYFQKATRNVRRNPPEN